MKHGRCPGARTWIALLLVVLTAATARAEDMKFFTGPERSSQQLMASDFAAVVGARAGGALTVVPTAGPADVLQQLRDAAKTSDGTNLATLQADVAYLYLLAALRGNAAVASWLAPLRVLAPLQTEELHFLVRRDSRFETLSDIRDARINVGPANGGSALSTVTLYRLLFDAAMSEDKVSRLSHEEALKRLLTDGSVEVVAMLGDQPMALVANMKPEARRFVRLLKFDPAATGGTTALSVYRAATLRQSSYPNLLDADLPALAVPIYLVAYDPKPSRDKTAPAQLMQAYCEALPQLKAQGRPQWQDVEPGLPQLAPGWHYAEMAAMEMVNCPGVVATEIPDVCLPQERALGLCN
ncbi:MAG TPA: TAXI family TRAP transporter solute-binding subunit [Rhodocyclaceae bacterium]|nr:TAXI family TRAP transporter solute-binding subunit [Rhodocyclaceae bacterium]